MHYESDGDGFVSLNLLMRRSNICGETKGSQIFSLPQRGISQNQVFDRGKNFEEVLVAWGHHLVQIRVVSLFLKF